jgi:hypothetical protein
MKNNKSICLKRENRKTVILKKMNIPLIARFRQQKYILL